MRSNSHVRLSEKKDIRKPGISCIDKPMNSAPYPLMPCVLKTTIENMTGAWLGVCLSVCVCFKVSSKSIKYKQNISKVYQGE